MFKTIQAIHNLLGMIVAIALLGLLAVGGWFGYRTLHGREDVEKRLAAREAEIQNLNEELAVRKREVARLETANRLLKVDHRVALLKVISQEYNADGKVSSTECEFKEVDQQGRPLGEPRKISVKGDMVYVEAWVVNFDDKLVEAADPLRGTSLCLFKRAFGEHQTPANGFRLDQEGSLPVPYRGGKEMSPLEREIWNGFWELSNDPEKQSKLGIRAVGGRGISQKVEPEKTYRVILRSSGGLSVVPENTPPKPGDTT